MVVGYGMLALLALSGGDTIRNILYLVPVSLAFLVGAYFVAKTSNVVHGWPALAWLVCASVNALIAVGSVLLDPWLCSTFGA
eukprot:c9876_g1_i1 orf=1-243(-)